MKTHNPHSRRFPRRGFTLIELLVVIAIISLLVSILIPSLQQARELARQTVCGTNEHHLGYSVQMYANDFRGETPYSLFYGYTQIWSSPANPLAKYLDMPERFAAMPANTTEYKDAVRDWMKESILKCPSESREPYYDSWDLNPWPDYTVNQWALPSLAYNLAYGFKISWTIDALTHPATTLLAADKGWGPNWSVHDACYAASPYQPDTCLGIFPYARHGNQNRLNVVFVEGHVENMEFDDLADNQPKYYPMNHMY